MSFAYRWCKDKTDAQQRAQDDPATYDLPVKIAQDARSQREQRSGWPRRNANRRDAMG